MSSFDSQPMYQESPVWDNTDVWWARDRWRDPDFEDGIHGLGGSAYELCIDREATLPEGIMFFHDPQVNVGMVWSLFDPAKEIKRGE